MDKSLKKWAVRGAVGLVILVLFLWLNPFVIVSAGERGVVMNWGAVSSKIMLEGLNFRLPIMQSIQKMDVQIQKENVKASACSKDLQELKTEIALNFHLQADRVNSLYQTIGMSYKERIIDPAIQEAVKAVTAKYTAEEVVTRRAQVRDDIRGLLDVRLKREFIIVDELSITNFDFSSSFNRAIEDKVTAEQQALQAKNILEKVKFEAEQRISQAKGEAEAIRIQVESISKQGGESYVQMKAIEKWDGKLPMQMIPNATVPFLELRSAEQQ